MQIFNTGSVSSAHMKRTCTKCISKVLMQLQSNQLQPSTMQLLVRGHLSTGVQGWAVVTCSSNSGFCTYDHSLCKYFREWTLGFYFWNHLSLKKNTGYLQAGSWDVKFRVGLSCCEIWCKKKIYLKWYWIPWSQTPFIFSSLKTRHLYFTMWYRWLGCFSPQLEWPKQLIVMTITLKYSIIQLPRYKRWFYIEVDAFSNIMTMLNSNVFGTQQENVLLQDWTPTAEEQDKKFSLSFN